MERCQPIDQLPTYWHSKEMILFTTARATRVPVGSDQINAREWSSSGAQHGRRSEPHIPVKTGDRERHPIRPCMIVWRDCGGPWPVCWPYSPSLKTGDTARARQGWHRAGPFQGKDSRKTRICGNGDRRCAHNHESFRRNRCHTPSSQTSDCLLGRRLTSVSPST
jgi:hypothetical protein